VEACWWEGLSGSEAAHRLGVNSKKVIYYILTRHFGAGACWIGRDIWLYEEDSLVFGRPRSSFVLKANPVMTEEQKAERRARYEAKFAARIAKIIADFHAANPYFEREHPGLLAELLDPNWDGMIHVSKARAPRAAAPPVATGEHPLCELYAVSARSSSAPWVALGQ
jgi:hypothetical protein